MKKTKRQIVSIVVVGLLLLAFVPTAHAQKSAFVDTQYILKNIPEYTDAQDILNSLSKKWQEEITEKHKEVSEMYKKYQAEAILLPADVKKKREDEIVKKDNEVKALQKEYFGPGGDLFKKREELIKPIQEKVYNAIETIATTENIAFVFDKAGSPTLLYGNPKYDISDAVLDELGKVMQTNSSGSR